MLPCTENVYINVRELSLLELTGNGNRSPVNSGSGNRALLSYRKVRELRYETTNGCEQIREHNSTECRNHCNSE